MHISKVSASFFICMLLLSFAGCKNGKKKEFNGEWYINPYHDKYMLEAANEHTILRLYPESIFTQFGESGYYSGTWKLNTQGNYLHLTRKQGTLPLIDEFLKIAVLQSGEMTLGVFGDLSFDRANKQMIIQLLQHKNKSDEDPYTPALQAWRLKPSQPESDIAIRKRW